MTRTEVCENMKKKTIFVLPVICLLILIQIIVVDSPPYSITDPIDDVRHYQNTTLVSTGDFHDEIDIKEFIVNSLDMIMVFDDIPLYLTDYIYVMAVFWDGDSNSDNYTYAQFSGGTINQVGTYLFDSQGLPVVLNITPGAITTIGDTLKTRIPSFALIQDILNPQYVSVHASYIEIAGQNYYTDNLTDGDPISGTPTNGSPGYQFGIVISGICVLVIVGVYLTRKK